MLFKGTDLKGAVNKPQTFTTQCTALQSWDVIGMATIETTLQSVTWRTSYM